MNYYRVLKDYVGRELNEDESIILFDDGDGKPYIKEWNVDGVAKPTKSAITSHYNANKNTIDKTIEIENLKSKYREKIISEVIETKLANNSEYQAELADIESRYS